MDRNLGFRHSTRVLGTFVLLGSVSTASAAEILINSHWTSTPSNPLPESIKVIRVQRPSYGDRATDDGFMNSHREVHLEGLPVWYRAFWGPYWGAHWNHAGGYARNQRLNDDKFYRYVMGELERQLRRNRPDVRLTDIEDRAPRSDANDDRRAAGDATRPSIQTELKPDALIMVRFSLDVRDESKIENPKLHEHFFSSAFGVLPIIGPGVRATTRPRGHVEYVRTITVACDMSLESIETGEVLASYNGVLDVRHETDRGIFGYGQERHADLSPVAQNVKKLVSEHVVRFLGQVIPVERNERIHMVGANADVIAAVKKMNGGRQFEAAVAAKRAYHKSRQRDHRAAFVAAKACEQLGEYGWAVTWMQRAIDLESDEMLYLKHMDWIEQELENQSRAVHFEHETQGSPALKPGEQVKIVTGN